MSLPSLRERIANLKKRQGEEEKPSNNAIKSEFETPSVCRATDGFTDTAECKRVISPEILTSSPTNSQDITG